MSEKDVKANPLSFLNYSTKEISADEKIEKLEKEINELKEYKSQEQIQTSNKLGYNDLINKSFKISSYFCCKILIEFI